MDQTSVPQPIAPSTVEDLNLPLEAVTLAPENLLEPASSDTRISSKILEWSDERLYAQHWGINE